MKTNVPIYWFKRIKISAGNNYITPVCFNIAFNLVRCKANDPLDGTCYEKYYSNFSRSQRID